MFMWNKQTNKQTNKGRKERTHEIKMGWKKERRKGMKGKITKKEYLKRKEGKKEML